MKLKKSYDYATGDSVNPFQKISSKCTDCDFFTLRRIFYFANNRYILT